MSRESPFGRFFQLGYVTRDIDAADVRMTADLGARRLDMHHELRDHDGNLVAMLRNLAHYALGGVEVELIEPRLDDPKSVYLDALPDSPDAFVLHHLGYLVADDDAFERAIAHARDIAAPIALAIETPKVRLAYIDTRATTGHYSEVVLCRFERYDTSIH